MNPDTITLHLSPEVFTPEQLAEAFWAMDSRQQARFFGHLGACALATPDPFTKALPSWGAFDFQMFEAGCYPATPLASEVMRRIGETADRAQSDMLRKSNTVLT